MRSGQPAPAEDLWYCMTMLNRRVQILLDEASYRKVATEAERRGTSVAAVIRDAIETTMGEPTGPKQRRAAIAAILGAEPMPMPGNASELRRELDAAHDPAQR